MCHLATHLIWPSSVGSVMIRLAVKETRQATCGDFVMFLVSARVVSWCLSSGFSVMIAIFQSK